MGIGFADEKARAFPPIVQVTVTNVCDMQCRHCPHTLYKREPTYRRAYMPMSVFRKVADECADYPGSCLRIFGWGEPLLHPQLPDMIAYAKRCGVTTTNLITNGLKLHDEYSRSLIRAGLDVLEVSIDALTAETYAQVRGEPRNLWTVVANTQRYIAIRDQLHGSTYVAVSIIDQPRAHHEVELFKQYWAKRADDVVVRRFHDFMGGARDRELIVLGPRKPCRVQWSRIHVNMEGLVSICFNDWQNESVLGDMKSPSTTIAGLWRSEQYEELRRCQLAGQPKGICANCNCWVGASWENPYENLIAKASLAIAHRSAAQG